METLLLTKNAFKFVAVWSLNILHIVCMGLQKYRRESLATIHA
jgi:hypothetical protein